MSAIGLLTCEILSREFAYILGKDPDLARVTVVEEPSSAGLIGALESFGSVSVHRVPHISSFRPEPLSGLEVLVRVLDSSLHRNRKALQRRLSGAASELSHRVDALLLGYGLCGNPTADPREELDVAVPVFMPTEGSSPVDDCVSMVIGGKEVYYAEQRGVPGTYFLTPGWSLHWRDALGSGPGARMTRAAKRMFDRYERALMILTPAMTEDEMRHGAEPFARELGLRLDTRQGSLEILFSSWQSAKASLPTEAEPPVLGSES